MTPTFANTAMWRLIVANEDECRDALLTWDSLGPTEARRRGVVALADLLRHVGRISEQLVTLRTVQTLSLIDLLNYRQHVYRLGAYGVSGDLGGDWLVLDPEVS